MSRFDVPGKPRSWHTAFYYLAEHVRLITDGTVNHKGLYALIGTEGRYLNHENPNVRKSTAGALSRLVHSRGYVRDMKNRYLQDASTFVRAAHEVCLAARRASGYDDAQLSRYLREECWLDVREGLLNEQTEWRTGIDLGKLDIETKALFAEASGVEPIDIDVRVAVTGVQAEYLEADGGLESSEVLLATMLRVLAFDGLGDSLARTLLDRYPTGVLSQTGSAAFGLVSACLVKFVDEQHSALVGTWTLPPGRPLTIGRYTDCDIVETDPGVSRIHCSVRFSDGAWNFMDCRSHNGSRVVRGGSTVYRSARDGSERAFPLEHGDVLVLAERSYFWFGAMVKT